MMKRGLDFCRSPRPCRLDTGLRGFSLIEILITCAIIGILALMALPRFMGAREKAYRSQMQTGLRTLVTAEEAYFDSHYAYTDDLGQLDYNETPMVTVEVFDVVGNGWSAKATHEMTPDECGIFIGPATPPAGITIPGEGIVACTN
jgi:prepilin-type N-terminal cleavage/methylation domain-containing protein